MGAQALPHEILSSLTDQWPCREVALGQLCALLNAGHHAPSTVVVYGPKGTGKSNIVQGVLSYMRLRHAIIACRECVTGRQLFERTIAAVRSNSDRANGVDVSHQAPPRCESISALSAQLQVAIESSDSFFVVFDGIDEQREAPPTLLAALARLGEMIPRLHVILILRHPAARQLHRTGVPFVCFNAYTRSQAIQILARQPLDIFPTLLPDTDGYDDEVHQEDKSWLWPRFCAAVWDSLVQNAARDLVSFRSVCHKLWRPFVEPIVKGDFGTQDFSRLMVAQRRLFQDESILVDTIISQGISKTVAVQNHELPYHAQWLLLAAYLASFNPAKTDALHFMKSTERKKRRRGAGGARVSRSGSSQVRKTPRHLLNPSAFTLDRMIAIFHAIVTDETRTTIDTYTQVATLTSLKFLVRTAGIGSADPLEPGGKWRVGPVVTWEFAQSLARSLDFTLQDYVAE